MLAVGIVMCVISALCLLVSLRHFRQKGFLLNNAYIYASKEERERGDYSPHYRQSAIVFLMIALQFLMIALFAFGPLEMSAKRFYLLNEQGQRPTFRELKFGFTNGKYWNRSVRLL